MRVTERGKRLLSRLAARRGVLQTAIVEQLIRAEADREGIIEPETDPAHGQNVAAKEMVAAA